jgi:cytidine deaminase
MTTSTVDEPWKSGQMSGIDWPALQQAALTAMRSAYVPYSHFPVGAAGLVDDGRVVTGCNVENASYGVGLCAECGLVSALALSGGGRLVAVSCVAADGDPVMPCGRCRQLLWEHGGPDLLVHTAQGPWRMADVLPLAFGPGDLTRAASPGTGDPSASPGTGERTATQEHDRSGGRGGE